MKKNLLFTLIIPFFGAVAALTLLNGCSDSQPASDSAHGHSHGDNHAPPHGGTPVIVGEDKFHLELVLDATTGRIQAYVLDGHLEGYVPVAEANFLLLAKRNGKEERITFQRAPDAAGNDLSVRSSLFEAQADGLKSATMFEGNIPLITLDGTTFTNIVFSFPKGSKHVH